MANKRDPYRRCATRPIPREDLAPVSARQTSPTAETLVGCPWCCGCGMVTPKKRVEWLATYPELHKDDGGTVPGPRDSEPPDGDA